jgi:sugar O-acyltransferase (sialic acid O-acetyltransferase NeuD family)
MTRQSRESQPAILLGAGGHAGVVLNAMRLDGMRIVGICDPALDGKPADAFGLLIIDGNHLTETHAPANFNLVNGVGMVPDQSHRRDLFQRMLSVGYSFVRVVHPTAIIDDTARIEDGAQVMAGAIIQNLVSVGPQAIINTGAQIDHGCSVGAMSHICPGAVLSGDVIVGENVFIGAGAIVINGVRIGNDVVIGAGAVITRDVPAGTKVITPASRDLAP